MTRWTDEQLSAAQARHARWKQTNATKPAGESSSPAPVGEVAPLRAKADSGTGTERRAVSIRPAAASSPPVYPLVGLCRAAGLPEPIPEYRFHFARKWRADYCWPIHKVLVEIDGAVWSQGRHTRGAGFIADQKKLNAAALLGYRVLRYTPDRLGEAIGDLRIMFAPEAA